MSRAEFGRVPVTAGTREPELPPAVREVVETLVRDGFVDSAVRDDERRLRRLAEILGAPLRDSAARTPGANADQSPSAESDGQHGRVVLASIVAASGAMRHVCEQVAEVARTDLPVLLRGEPGTGKELVATAIHQSSPRASRPFIKLDCGHVPPGLIDVELFGHEASVVSGIRPERKGRLELADGGTLLLSGVEELHPITQRVLLRAIHDREVQRVGGTERIPIDVRLIVTMRDARHAAADADTREELHSALNPFVIEVPPLRDRRADLPTLVEVFIERIAREHGKRVSRLSTRTSELLVAYPWPGNARELRDVIERAVVQCQDSVIHPHHLPSAVRAAERSADPAAMGLSEALAAYEKELLEDALRSARGVRSRAARLLKTTERIFNYRIRRYGIDCRQFRG